MAPFVKSSFRLKDNFLTLRSLRDGLYEVNVDRVIDDMSKRVSESGIFTPLAAGIRPDATMGQLREYLMSNQARIGALANDIEMMAENAEGCGDTMRDMAACTKWRLGYDVALAAIFSAFGVAGIVVKRKFATFIGFFAAVGFALSFLDELDIRSAELNEQFDCLHTLCNCAAEDLIEFALRRSGHNFMFHVLKDRFGDAFEDPDPTEEELEETYADGGGVN